VIRPGAVDPVKFVFLLRKMVWTVFQEESKKLQLQRFRPKPRKKEKFIQAQDTTGMQFTKPINNAAKCLERNSCRQNLITNLLGLGSPPF